MKEKKIQKICSKCGRQFEPKDALPLCPECLFGISDTNGSRKIKYPSALSAHISSDWNDFIWPSGAASGR